MSSAVVKKEPLGELTGMRLKVAMFALSVVTAMTVLDTTIANVALPTIAGNLAMSQSQSTWVITFYCVANAIAIPMTGWLAGRWGEVRVFMLATLIFTVASLFCGLSENLAMLVACRVIQGAAAGPLMPLSQSLLLRIVCADRKNIALALWSMTVVVSPILGPILGGWICDNWTWHWIFFVNVPTGILCLACLKSTLGDRETPTERIPGDVFGLIFLTLAVGSLQLLLDEGKDKDWFASDYITTLTVISVVSFVCLVFYERKAPNPVIRLDLFANRNFSLCTLLIAGLFMVFFASVVILPTLLQARLGYTALWAGFSLAPVGIFSVLLSPVVGKLASRVDLRLFACIGSVVFAGTFWMRAVQPPEADYFLIMLPQLFQGIGMAFLFMPLTSLSLLGVATKDVASASSLTTAIRVLAGSLCSSVATTFWERREALHHTQWAEAITSDQLEAVIEASGQLNPQASLVWLNNEVTRQGFLLGFNELFFAGMWVFVFIGIFVWFARSNLSVERHVKPEHQVPALRSQGRK